MQGSQRIPKTIHTHGEGSRVANQGFQDCHSSCPRCPVAFAGCCITWLGRRIAANVFGGWFRLHLSVVFVFDFLILRFFFQVVCVKTGATCSFGVFAANWREFDAFFGQKRSQAHFATKQQQRQQQQDICFNWMDNLATAMTSKAGCLDQLTARNSHGLYSRSLEQNVQRLAGLFLRQTNKIKNTNRPKDKKAKKNEKTTAIKPKYNRNCEKLHFEFFHSPCSLLFSPLSVSFWGN